MSEATIAVLTALLEPKDVAQMLNVKVSWVYASAEKGVLPSYRVGKYRRFRHEQIEEWLAQQEAK
jgi:excisionase family DNA binding protein